MEYEALESGNQSGGLFGVYMGVVADLKDPEDMGRVKVKFPWREVDDKSEWARLATPMAGKEMGQYFLPEKGDEVLVAFGGGDIHEPYIVGGLWNGKQMPPQPNRKENPIRQIKSRADHKFTFDDTDNIGKVEIKTGKGQKVVIDDKNEKIQIKDINDNEILMDSEGITITSPETVTIDAKKIVETADNEVEVSGQSITESARSKMDISSNGGLSVTAQARGKVKANSMLDIKSGGLVKVNGQLIKLN